MASIHRSVLGCAYAVQYAFAVCSSTTAKAFWGEQASLEFEGQRTKPTNLGGKRYCKNEIQCPVASMLAISDATFRS